MWSDAPPSIRVQAAIALLDRGWGKPGQDIDNANGISLAEAYAELCNIGIENGLNLTAPLNQTSQKGIRLSRGTHG